MNMLSPRVLVAAALAASPALYQGFVTGAVTMDTAIERYLFVVVLAWLALSVLEAMVGPPPPRPRRDELEPLPTDGSVSGG